MRYMKQFGIILAVTCVGDFLNFALPLPIPGSIYGLVIMLILLITGVIKIYQVKDSAEFLIDIMPMMFIPAAVGLLVAWGDLRPVLLPVLVTTVASTVIVMAVTGRVSQAVMRFRKRETSKTDAIISAEYAKKRLEDVDE